MLNLRSPKSRIQISQNASQGVRQRSRMSDVPAEVQAEADVHGAHEEEARNRVARLEALSVPVAKLLSTLRLIYAYKVETHSTSRL